MRRPLSVVGTDQEALKALLSLHAPPEPRILDVTANRGRFWRGLPYKPHRLDRDPALFDQGFTDTIADFRALPFGPGEFDVIVFDPPHITDAGRDGLVGERGSNWAERFGTLSDGYVGTSIVPMFEPFLHEATRVLTQAGIVLAKIADQVHMGEYRWQHVELISVAQKLGMTACDAMLTVHWGRGGLQDPRWKRVCHVRQVHTYWLCLRNGPACISPTAPAVDVKPKTGAMFA